MKRAFLKYALNLRDAGKERAKKIKRATDAQRAGRRRIESRYRRGETFSRVWESPEAHSAPNATVGVANHPDAGEAKRAVEEERAVRRTIDPLVHRGFDPLIILREDLRVTRRVLEPADARAEGRLILRPRFEVRVERQRGQSITRSSGVGDVEEGGDAFDDFTNRAVGVGERASVRGAAVMIGAFFRLPFLSRGGDVGLSFWGDVGLSRGGGFGLLSLRSGLLGLSLRLILGDLLVRRLSESLSDTDAREERSRAAREEASRKEGLSLRGVRRETQNYR